MTNRQFYISLKGHGYFIPFKKFSELKDAEEFAGIKFDASRSTSIDDNTVQVKSKKRSSSETPETQSTSKVPKLSNETKAPESMPSQTQELR